MSCKTGRTWMQEMLWEPERSVRRSQWEQHLAVCPECRGRWRALQASEQRLQSAFTDKLPGGFASAVLRRAQAVEPVRPVLRWWLPSLAGAAAAVLLAVGMSVVQPRIPASPSQQAWFEDYDETLNTLHPEARMESEASELDYTRYGVPREVAKLLL